MNRPKTSTAALLILATLLLGLTSCDYLHPDREVNGSVFIVTSGAGAYKLALVKVYFCDADDFRKKVDPLVAEFKKHDSTNFNNAIAAEKEYVEAMDRTTASFAKQKDAFAMMVYAKEQMAKTSKTIDEAAQSLERSQRIIDPYATIYNPDPRLNEKMKTFEDYFRQHPPTPGDKHYVDSITNMYSLLKIALQKTVQENDVVFSGTTKVGEELSKATDNFKAVQTTLTDYPKAVAEQCSEQIESAKFVAETDADGLYKVKLPKKGNYIAVAKAERTVGGTKKEFYWWIVPVIINPDTNMITLSNDNELFTSEGSKIVDLHSAGAGHEWRSSQEADKKVKDAMALVEEQKAKFRELP